MQVHWHGVLQSHLLRFGSKLEVLCVGVSVLMQWVLLTQQHSQRDACTKLTLVCCSPLVSTDAVGELACMHRSLSKSITLVFSSCTAYTACSDEQI